MPVDFKAKQIRVNQIINSGSSATSPLLIYGLGSATDESGGFTSSHFVTGSDTWLFISGASGSKNSSLRGVVAFKGDVVVSGTIYNSAGSAYSVGGGGGGSGNWNELSPSPRLNTTASVAIAGGLGSSYAAQSAGSDVFFFVSGSVDGTNKSVFGGSVRISGSLSQGKFPTATGDGSHAEGDRSSATGAYSHAEGLLTEASNNYSHAEGNLTIASGFASHAEGDTSTASGYGSHAEGYQTLASTDYAHAEGQSTVALGLASHAEGYGTIASGSYQHVSGKFNKRNNNFSLFVVGDGSGTSDATRRDVLRVNSGSVEITGSFIAPNITGSLTRLSDGITPYLKPGSNVTLTTGSDGSVTIASTGGSGSPAGSNTHVQFNADGVFAGTSGLTFATGSSSLTISGDLAVDGGDITTTSNAATIFSTNVSSLSLASVASSISIGGASSSTSFTINVAANRTGNSTLNLGTGATSTGNTKNINIGQGGDPGSTTNVRIGTTDTAASTNVYMSGSVYVTGSVGIKGSIIPDATSTYTLGTDSLRWAHVYTGDLHLRNERGDWTIIEENDFLRIVNNKTGKSFKMLMQPLD